MSRRHRISLAMNDLLKSMMKTRILARGIVGIGIIIIIAIPLMPRSQEESDSTRPQDGPVMTKSTPTLPATSPTLTVTISPTPNLAQPQQTHITTPVPTTTTIRSIPVQIPTPLGYDIPPLPISAFVAEKYFQAYNNSDMELMEKLFVDHARYVLGPITTNTGKTPIILNSKKEILDYHRKIMRDRPGKLGIYNSIIKGTTLDGNFTETFEYPGDSSRASLSGTIKIVVQGNKISKAEFILDERSQITLEGYISPDKSK